MTSKKPTLRPGVVQSTFFPEDSRVSQSVQQERDSVTRMIDSSGRNMLERSGKFSQHGSFQKTFMELLLGSGAYYSNRCVLKWRVRAMKSARLLYQLQVSDLPTEETGSGLLPTPKSVEIEEDYQEWRQRMINSGNPKNMGKTIPNLGTMARGGFLPTPRTSDHKGAVSLDSEASFRRHQHNRGITLPEQLQRNTGTTGLLNPRFVEEMMGFPIGWTELSPSETP